MQCQREGQPVKEKLTVQPFPCVFRLLLLRRRLLLLLTEGEEDRTSEGLRADWQLGEGAPR